MNALQECSRKEELMKMFKGCFVFFSTSHEHVLGENPPQGRPELVLSWAQALGLAVCPSLPQGPGFPSGLSMPCFASLAPWHMPFAASDLIVVLQTLVQARHPGPPADEAPAFVFGSGRAAPAIERQRVSCLGPQPQEVCLQRHRIGV